MFDLLRSFIPESRTTQAIFIGVIVALIVSLVRRKRYRLPPGPWGLPLIGNILAIRKVALHVKLCEWRRTYGPVITCKLGPFPVVCLNSLDVIQEAFVKKSAAFAGRPHLYSISQITDGYKDIAFTNYGPTWQLHRRMAIKALNFYMKGDKFEKTVQEAMETVLVEMKSEKEAFDFQDYAKLVVFNILATICFNERFSLDNEDFKKFSLNLDITRNELGNGFWEDVIPPLKYWPTRKYRKLLSLSKELGNFIKLRVKQHIATFSAGTQRDFTDALLLAQEEAKAEENPEILEQITDTHIAQTVNDIFQAGVDTTRQTIYWAVLYMVAYPKLQAKVREEVDRVLGERKHAKMTDREHLPYTLAVLYETMRLAPIAPLALPHTTMKDTTVGGYEVPKGTMVMANVYAVHNDPNLWDHPEDYRPERFLDSSGKMIPKPEQWMPFSVGKRACLAESLAKPEIHMILATLFKNLELRVAEGTEANLEPENIGFSVFPKPYKIVAKERN